VILERPAKISNSLRNIGFREEGGPWAGNSGGVELGRVRLQGELFGKERIGGRDQVTLDGCVKSAKKSDR